MALETYMWATESSPVGHHTSCVYLTCNEVYVSSSQSNCLHFSFSSTKTYIYYHIHISTIGQSISYVVAASEIRDFPIDLTTYLQNQHRLLRRQGEFHMVLDAINILEVYNINVNI